MKPYNREESTKSEEVKEMFDNIAPEYDKLNHILSVQIDKIWRKRVVRIVEGFNPAEILDLATGTGDLAIAMAQRVSSAHVVGIDLSEGMLAVARRKVEQRGLSSRIDLRCGVAESIDMADGTVDVVTAAFGVRNFGDLIGGFSEMARVTKSGGHIVVLEFSTPQNPLFRWFYNLYSRHILPIVGGLISKDRRAYEYLPASVDEFPEPMKIVEMLQSVGFEECKVRSQSFGIAQIYIGRKV
ncbi:MAG: bifunctional demethylmenaquinone methyltransferase/2-methoxy-6-polyprenyl-1,4-benzoquinol methylase UbiE [Rikenellaceae bacterium]